MSKHVFYVTMQSAHQKLATEQRSRWTKLGDVQALCIPPKDRSGWRFNGDLRHVNHLFAE